MKVINIKDFCIPAKDAGYDELSNFADEIAELATYPIEAEPVRRGRWKTFYHGDNNFSFACNKCYTPNWWKTRYCPGCGALMEDEE